jgi:trehalose/maltose hydrolase-like predicted phosphorylase
MNDDASFRLTATAADFGGYFPTYLANGHFSTDSSLHGTRAALSLMTGLMDRTPDDVSRPAALPGWMEVDYHNGAGWLNEAEVSAETFRDYAQTLDMRDGVLHTHYDWVSGGKSTRVAVTTFVSQADFHLAATRVTLTPRFSGSVRLRFPLHHWPAPLQRFALAKLSWSELKDVLAAGKATRPLSDPSRQRTTKPREIFTWFDLQDALAAEGRELVTPSAVAPTRAPIWYPGEVAVHSATGDLSTLQLRLDGAALGGSAFAVGVAVELPPELRASQARLEEGPQGPALAFEFQLRAGVSYVFGKYALLTREGWGDRAIDVSEQALAARTSGFDRLLQRHQAAWHKLWESDIIVEGDARLQKAIRSDLFYLRQNSAPEGSLPMAACGMSPNYFGHAFWDNDTWDFPAVLLFHPERARALVAFRQRTLEWARMNAARRGFAGAMYPWESDPETGTEQTPHFAGVNAHQEIYLNGAIASAQWQYYLATGDVGWLREHGFPVIRATADFWVSRVAHNAEKNRYEILHVTSVDEKYTDVNNEAFTNAVAWRNLVTATEAARVLGEKPDVRWAEIAARMYLPFSETERRHLPFDESVPHDRQTWMAGAITLLCYPNLDFPMPDDVRRNNYDYALRKNAELTRELNQMMLVMLAIHAAELGDAAGARKWLLHQQEKFLKPPFNVRSETPHNNCTHILATAGGFLQNFLFGFTGLRLAGEGLVAKYAPVLPAEFKQITLQGVAVRGERFDFAVARDATGQVRLTKKPAAPAPAQLPNS